MSKPALASLQNSLPGRIYDQDGDPFSNPSAEPIQRPRPCLQIPSNPRLMRAIVTADENTADGHARTPPHSPYKAGYFGSMSSDGSGSLMSPISSIDLEKSLAQEKATRKLRRDPEKAVHHAMGEADQQTAISHPPTMTYFEDDADDTRRVQEQHAVKILLFLSGPCVVLSALNAVWTCISVIITLLSQPVRLCAKRLTFGQQLGGLLGPALNLQLRCIYMPLHPHANEDASYHTLMLVAVHLLSPFLSLALVFVAWVFAAYWVVSLVLGDPAGMDKRDDGRDAVLSLRKWWELWLLRGIKEE